MTDLMTYETDCVCPPWCLHEGDPDRHAHVSADVRAGAEEQLLTARLVQMSDDTDPKVLLNGRAAGLGELGRFVRGLQRLLDEARMAPAGLGFVDALVARAGLTLSDVAEEAGLDVAWVRAQHAGRQVLTVREFERLAIAAASLAATCGLADPAAS